jgi:hypothetical protein
MQKPRLPKPPHRHLLPSSNSHWRAPGALRQKAIHGMAFFMEASNCYIPTEAPPERGAAR